MNITFDNLTSARFSLTFTDDSISLKNETHQGTCKYSVCGDTLYMSNIKGDIMGFDNIAFILSNIFLNINNMILLDSELSEYMLRSSNVICYGNYATSLLDLFRTPPTNLNTLWGEFNIFPTGVCFQNMDFFIEDMVILYNQIMVGDITFSNNKVYIGDVDATHIFPKRFIPTDKEHFLWLSKYDKIGEWIG